jgi:hypothetical protein
MKISRIVTIIVFLLTAAGIAAFVFFPGNFFHPPAPREIKQTRVIERGEARADAERSGVIDENVMYEVNAKIALESGEILVTVLSENFDDDPQEEQILAYRNLTENDGPICLAYVDFDETARRYKRVWDVQTIATRSGTISLYTQDFVGDRVPCVILTGMNAIGERTLTVFRKNSTPDGDEAATEPFSKIAEIQIDGTISVQESARTQAYQQGMANGQPFPLIAYGRDAESPNFMDRIELVYTYKSETQRYEQTMLTRIPGKQVEERRVREILSGGAKTFVAFIAGLWYYVRPDGAIDSRQYIYFDPESKEIVFYIDETQQVFTWQNSGATRYGLYISCQNISVQTLRRSLDIALESLDSIRVKVSEDVRLKIGTDAGWDGSYRKIVATTATGMPQKALKTVPAYINAIYDGSIGKISFSEDGAYMITAGETRQSGRYSFFILNDREMLELRPGNSGRETYLVERPEGNLSLQRIRIGANGVHDLHEPALFLTPAL